MRHCSAKPAGKIRLTPAPVEQAVPVVCARLALHLPQGLDETVMRVLAECQNRARP